MSATSVCVLIVGGALGGYYVRPLFRRWWKRLDKDTEAKMDKLEALAYEKGMREALSVIVDTDENAAIVEAIGADILQQEGVRLVTAEEMVAAESMNALYRQMTFSFGGYGHYRERGWVWNDAKLKRASLTAKGSTPREAYKSYLAQRAAADAIGEQLDEVERIRNGEAA
jgi:hypothetical protein